ncbi:MAG: hypothetical protein RL220_1178 [Bacteroidota bacterium]
MPALAWAQPQGEVIDKIIAVVGDEIVLYSDLQNAVLEYTEGKGRMPVNQQCALLENLMFNKILVHQAKLDSLEVSDTEVEENLERRLARLVGYFGSVEEFEKYYNKTIIQLKDEFRSDIREQLLAEKMQGKISSSATVTPAQITEFYNLIPADSLPLIGTQVQYSQILMRGPIRETERQRVRHVLDSIRNDIMSGKTTMLLQAARWSEDPGSRAKGGCYDLQSKGTFVPEYEAAVYNTPEGSYSPVFESKFGFHFVKVVEKRGNFYEACHILMTPKVDPMDLDRRRVSLDSLRQKINAGNINFEQAVLQYSEDENTKNQGGKVIDGSSLGNRFDVSSLPAEVNLVLDKMKPGDVSDPVLIEEMNGNYSYVIYRLDARIEPHRADLKNDYAMFQEMAGNKLRQDKLFKWAAKKIAQTYVSVDPMYHVGPYQLPWIKGN